MENEVKQIQFSMESRQFLEKKEKRKHFDLKPNFHWKRVLLQNVQASIKYSNKDKLMECSASDSFSSVGRHTHTNLHVSTYLNLRWMDCYFFRETAVSILFVFKESGRRERKFVY